MWLAAERRLNSWNDAYLFAQGFMPSSYDRMPTEEIIDAESARVLVAATALYLGSRQAISKRDIRTFFERSSPFIVASIEDALSLHGVPDITRQIFGTLLRLPHDQLFSLVRRAQGGVLAGTMPNFFERVLSRWFPKRWLALVGSSARHVDSGARAG